jgi:putative transposase
MSAVNELAPRVGVAAACQALGVSRACWYRHRPRPVEAPLACALLPEATPPSTPSWGPLTLAPGTGQTPAEVATPTMPAPLACVTPTPEEPALPARTSPRALSTAERAAVLDVLHSERFLDQAPAEVYAALLDEGIYHCSVRTMYRLLDAEGEIRERRKQARHPVYTRPELLAKGPNELWSWDITKLLGPAKWTYYYLYVILDVFSRYVVGWMLATRESAALAERLIGETLDKQGIPAGQLTIHADRGSSMTSKPVAFLLADLGVTKTHSRPHVSNDNPYSESQFKTMKYRPDFPARFGSAEDARAFCGPFFAWYNTEHHHSGLAFLTPEVVHFGQAEELLAARAQTLMAAYRAHPERFVHRPPAPRELPSAVWINPPEQTKVRDES